MFYWRSFNLSSLIRYHKTFCNIKEEVRVKSDTIALLRESNNVSETENTRATISKWTHCTFQTAEQSVLEEHHKIHDIYFICSVGCDVAFASQDELDIHMTSKHAQNNKLKVFKCTKCDSKFKTEKFLKLHTENLYT